MKLVGAALVLLAISGCSAEVVQDFIVSCEDFFADPNGTRSPPTRFNEPQYKQICQTLNDKVEYATYYDTANRIPVYSAYRFQGFKDCSGRKGSWFIEPQLDQEDGAKNMEPKETVPPELRGKHQALNEDYSNSSYDRGHLIPLYYAKTRSCATATFTLTNAAPQDRTFNNEKWKKTEQRMGKILSTDCLNVGLSAYVVTGVVPGNETIKNKTVNVPSYFWTAYCCLDNNNKPKVSGGFYGANKNKPVKKVSVSELESFLSNEYKNDQFQLFGNGSCMAGQGSTEAFNLDRSRTRLYIKKDYKRGFGSASSRERSRIERICARRLAFASSMFRSPIKEHYPRRFASASSMLRSLIDKHYARGLASDSSMLRSLIDKHYARGLASDSSMLRSPIDKHYARGFASDSSMLRSPIDKHYARGFASDSSMLRSPIDKHYARGLASASSMLRSPIDKHYARGFASDSSMLRSPIEGHYPRLFPSASSRPKSRVDEMCAKHFGFARSRLGSSAEEDYSGHFELRLEEDDDY